LYVLPLALIVLALVILLPSAKQLLYAFRHKELNDVVEKVSSSIAKNGLLYCDDGLIATPGFLLSSDHFFSGGWVDEEHAASVIFDLVSGEQRTPDLFALSILTTHNELLKFGEWAFSSLDDLLHACERALPNTTFSVESAVTHSDGYRTAKLTKCTMAHLPTAAYRNVVWVPVQRMQPRDLAPC
jgi:hypothetical protein